MSIGGRGRLERDRSSVRNEGDAWSPLCCLLMKTVDLFEKERSIATFHSSA